MGSVAQVWFWRFPKVSPAHLTAACDSKADSGKPPNDVFTRSENPDG